MCEDCGQSLPKATKQANGRVQCQFCATIPERNWQLVKRTDNRPRKTDRRQVDGIEMPAYQAAVYGEVACETVGVLYWLARSAVRTGNVSERRHLATYLMRRTGGLSYPSIACALNKNHTSCFYAVSILENRARADVNYAEMLARLRARYTTALNGRGVQIAA